MIVDAAHRADGEALEAEVCSALRAFHMVTTALLLDWHAATLLWTELHIMVVHPQLEQPLTLVQQRFIHFARHPIMAFVLARSAKGESTSFTDPYFWSRWDAM